LQDAKVVENASLALTRIAEALANSPSQMEMLCNQGLITNAMQLIAVSEGGSMTSQLAVSTYYGLIKLLRACASGSPSVAETLHQAGISATIRKLLSR
jgi:E3 ubiquitin-protein ligase TRIP12